MDAMLKATGRAWSGIALSGLLIVGAAAQAAPAARIIITGEAANALWTAYNREVQQGAISASPSGNPKLTIEIEDTPTSYAVQFYQSGRRLAQAGQPLSNARVTTSSFGDLGDSVKTLDGHESAALLTTLLYVENNPSIIGAGSGYFSSGDYLVYISPLTNGDYEISLDFPETNPACGKTSLCSGPMRFFRFDAETGKVTRLYRTEF